MHFGEYKNCHAASAQWTLLQHPAWHLLQGNAQEISYWAIMGKPVQIQNFLPASLSVNNIWQVLKYGGLSLLICLFQVLSDVCVFHIREFAKSHVFRSPHLPAAWCKTKLDRFWKGLSSSVKGNC